MRSRLRNLEQNRINDQNTRHLLDEAVFAHTSEWEVIDGRLTVFDFEPLRHEIPLRFDTRQQRLVTRREAKREGPKLRRVGCGDLRNICITY